MNKTILDIAQILMPASEILMPGSGCVTPALPHARAIYEAHVKPLEEALAKAEADKAELVEALEEMVSVAEIIAGFANIPANANGPLIKSRAALAKVKEASCQKD